jgi:hypothetical protein
VATVGVSGDELSENSARARVGIGDDTDHDSVADLLEQGVEFDPDYDGNADGSADWEQSNVLSAPLFGSDYATIVLPERVTVDGVTEAPISDLDLPKGALAPFGAFRLDLSMANSATVDLYLPEGTEYPFAHLLVAQAAGSPWQVAGKYEASEHHFSIDFDELGAEFDQDARSGRVTLLAAPAYNVLQKPDEDKGCALVPAARSRSALPWLAVALVPLSMLTLRRRAGRRRSRAKRSPAGTAP